MKVVRNGINCYNRQRPFTKRITATFFSLIFNDSNLFSTSAAKKLIQRYGDHQTFIDKTNNCGSTALLLAAQNNKIEVVRTLLETVSTSGDCFLLSFAKGTYILSTVCKALVLQVDNYPKLIKLKFN